MNNRLEMLGADGSYQRNWQNVQIGQTLDVSELPKGIYLLRLVANEESRTLRIVIQ